MKKTQMKLSYIAFALGMLPLLTSCGVGSKQMMLMEEDYAARLMSDPVVEVMIEYAAPAAGFGAAPSLTLQVSARDGKMAELKLYHGLWNDIVGAPDAGQLPLIDGGTEGRKPASIASTLHGPVAAKRFPVSTWQMNAGTLLEEFKDLALSGREPAAGFQGCTFPVKLRMVRTSGMVEELLGCRGAGGWTRRVSEAVERWMSAGNRASS